LGISVEFFGKVAYSFLQKTFGTKLPPPPIGFLQ
jgi:hypothetical protein